MYQPIIHFAAASRSKAYPDSFQALSLDIFTTYIIICRYYNLRILRPAGDILIEEEEAIN